MSDVKITRTHIEQLMALSTITDTKIGAKSTVVCLTMPIGFEIIETSSCVDPANYNHKLGVDLCKKRIIDKLFLLEGYRLAWEIAEDKMDAAQALGVYGDPFPQAHEPGETAPAQFSTPPTDGLSAVARAAIQGDISQSFERKVPAHSGASESPVCCGIVSRGGILMPCGKPATMAVWLPGSERIVGHTCDEHAEGQTKEGHDVRPIIAPAPTPRQRPLCDFSDDQGSRCKNASTVLIIPRGGDSLPRYACDLHSSALANDGDDVHPIKS